MITRADIEALIDERLQSLTLEEIIRRAYPVPTMCDSVESLMKFHHADIDELTDEQLDAERIRARLAWAFSRRPSEWLIERVGRVEAAASRRRARQRR